MMSPSFPLLTEKQLAQLKTSLVFLKVGELRSILESFGLPPKGKNQLLMTRLDTFITTGDIVSNPTLPQVSKALREKEYPLKSGTLILKGAYKNDLATRNFFKKLIGPHFHFTAFGIDWIEHRWVKGNPPTYQEFATFWQKEHMRRSTSKPNPKKEWAYINFTQQFLKKKPTAAHTEIRNAWKKCREQHVDVVLNLIDKAQKKHKS